MPVPRQRVEKSTRCHENEFFIFMSCIIFLCRPSKGFAFRRVRSANFQFAVASRANALPSFVARQSLRPGLSSAGPGFRCANSFAHLQVGVANPSTGLSPGTLGELLNRPPRPEGRRGYGAQIFDFSAPSRAKALPHYSPSLVGLKPSLICHLR